MVIDRSERLGAIGPKNGGTPEHLAQNEAGVSRVLPRKTIGAPSVCCIFGAGVSRALGTCPAHRATGDPNKGVVKNAFPPGCFTDLGPLA